MKKSDKANVPTRLFSPVALRGISARNRVVVSPMCQYRSVDGSPTDWHLVNSGRYAIGGAGIVFYEETAVEARGRKSYGCASIERDGQIPAYRRITDFIRAMGAVPAIQLGHSGAKGSVKGAMDEWTPLTAGDAAAGLAPWQTISASAHPFGTGRPPSTAMDQGEIDRVVAAFAAAAARSHAAGFDICEIHGAHGYLIHQFLSPVTNTRADRYGADRAGRMRFALEVTEAVRAAWPAHKPLFFRVSARDGRGGLWDIDDSVALAGALKERGVDVVDCSSGGITGTSSMPVVPRVPGYQVEFARRIKQAAGVPTMAVGLITEPAQAEAILQAGDADLIALARELMFNADWPVHAAKALGHGAYLSLLPPDFAFRLHRRDEVGRLPFNQVGASLAHADALVEST
ncbi:NADH:flavin oxidoreductase/NADH oxidase [Vineibacter terrae]|uniref:NADH:flavin oxidoreductase/NADH oxidase n=1 Tax=Vineibacter terrae TaxID=2586908 RepID=A0A5C8PA02_9HYPH|nr:NADH:flavin oxidoreductase/NADH oxidase [Vineibacter terrae]TXL70626.1 NADH:flavin oxidoreductase/NADH oxidase [Vineibacter terrae]